MKASEPGFTLLELLVVLAIAAVLMSASVPGFRMLSLSSARSAGALSLVTALNQARGEAIARNVGVSVCRRDFFSSAGSPRCDSGAGRWEEGWIVYVGASPDEIANVVGVYEPVGSVSANGSTNAFRLTASPAAATVQFLPNGRSSQPVSFTLCETSSVLREGRRVELAASGRASSRVLTAAETTSACAS